MFLKEKGLSGIIWTLFDSIIIQGLGLITQIILTRILLPEDFGLLSIVAVFITIGQAFVENGLGQSLIRDNNSNTIDYSTVFFGNIGFSIIAYLILFFLSPFIASYFEKSILEQILVIMGLNFIVSGFNSVQKKLLQKELAFKKMAMLNLPAVIMSSAISIFLAIKGYGIWSLVFRGLLLELFTSFSYWFKSDWKPQMVFSKKKFLYHFNFGYKLSISSILNAIFNEIYSLIIGRFADLSSLGYYNRAKKYNTFPIKIITKVITKVTYPLLSKIKEDKDKVSRIYQEILRSIFFLVTPLMFTLAIIAEPLFLLVFTKKWLFAVPYFQILTLSSILTPVHSMNLNVFKVYGRTDLTLKLSVFKKLLILVAIIPFFLFGIYGLLIGIVVNGYISLLINTYYSEDMIGYKLSDQLRHLFPTFTTAILSAILGYILLIYISNLSLLIQLALVPMTTLSIYIIMNIIIKNKSYFECLKFTLMFLNKFREGLEKE